MLQSHAKDAEWLCQGTSFVSRLLHAIGQPVISVGLIELMPLRQMTVVQTAAAIWKIENMHNDGACVLSAGVTQQCMRNQHGCTS